MSAVPLFAEQSLNGSAQLGECLGAVGGCTEVHEAVAVWAQRDGVVRRIATTLRKRDDMMHFEERRFIIPQERSRLTTLLAATICGSQNRGPNSWIALEVDDYALDSQRCKVAVARQVNDSGSRHRVGMLPKHFRVRR